MSLYRQIAGKLRRCNGWKRPTAPSPHPVFSAPEISQAIVSIPPELRPSVQDQGQIGDCVFQALRELMTGLFLREQQLDGLPLKEILLSVLAPYWWGRKIDGTAPTDDAGSSVSTGFTVATTIGLPRIETWPDSTPFSLQPIPAVEEDAKQRRVLLPFSLPNVATIKASVGQGFPVELGFDCPSDLFDAATQSTGDVQFHEDPTMYDGSGHAISIWESDDGYSIGSCKGAYLANFHWSKDAGVGGYFHLPHQYVISGRAGDAHTMRLEGAGR